MSGETLNAIVAVIAILGLVGNIVAFLTTRIELHGQREETKELVKLTSDLEHRVHRLATHLDQRIYRLKRVQDLTTELMKASIALRQQSRAFEDKLNTAVKRDTAVPELSALTTVIGDERLSQIFSEVEGVIFDPIWPLMWNRGESYDMGKADALIQDQSNYTTGIHRRVLELMEDTTSA